MVETEGRKRGRPRLSNRHATNSSNLRRTQQESCSVADQVANVKLSILDTLNTVRQFRAELEAREKNLEATLLEVDGLGMFMNQRFTCFKKKKKKKIYLLFLDTILFCSRFNKLLVGETGERILEISQSLTSNNV